MAMKLSVLFDGDTARLKASSKQAQSSLNSVKSTAVSVAKSVGAAYASYISLSQIVDVTKRYQRLEAQLRTSTGSVEGQAQAMAILSEFAYETGQDLEGLVEGFNKLVNLGLDPSQDALLAYGNVAAGTGKTTMDFIEAVADASVAEFERLKEFGIKAANEGDTVTFRFRGVTTSVKNNSEEIQQYLIGLGQTKFGDAIANQATTLEAALNRAGQKWDEFMFNLSNAGPGNIMTQTVNQAAEALDELGSMLASGEMQIAAEAWIGQFDQIGQAVENTTDFLYDNYMQMFFDARQFEQMTADIKPFAHMPTNISTMVQLMTVELAKMVDIGVTYGQAYATGFLSTLTLLKDRTMAIVYEINDILNPLNGSTYNFKEAWDQAGEAFDDTRNTLLDNADAQSEVFNKAAADTVSDILTNSQKAIDAYERKMAESREVRSRWQSEMDELKQGDLGQFNQAGDPAANDASFGPTADQNGEYNKLMERYATEEEALILHAQREMQIIAEAMAQKKVTEEQGMALIEAARLQHLKNVQTLEQQKASTILSSSEGLFNGLTSMIGTVAGEQSKAYKVMFAVTKGFAIAQGILNLSTAISNAMALPFPANIPAMANAAVAGANILTNIKSASYSGQAHDGLSRVPAANEGTFMLRRDEMVMNPRQRENFDKMRDTVENGGGQGKSINYSPIINIDATNATPGMEQMISDKIEQSQEQTFATIAEDFSNGGSLSQRLNGLAA
jgi:hypothetical protein